MNAFRAFFVSISRPLGLALAALASRAFAAAAETVRRPSNTIVFPSSDVDPFAARDVFATASVERARRVVVASSSSRARFFAAAGADPSRAFAPRGPRRRRAPSSSASNIAMNASPCLASASRARAPVSASSSRMVVSSAFARAMAPAPARAGADASARRAIARWSASAPLVGAWGAASIALVVAAPRALYVALVPGVLGALAATTFFVPSARGRRGVQGALATLRVAGGASAVIDACASAACATLAVARRGVSRRGVAIGLAYATHGAASIAVYAMAVDVQGAIEARDDDGDDSRDGFSA
jgi:hypothetical protein